MEAFRVGITPVVRHIQASAKIIRLHWTLLEGIGLSGADPQLAEQIVEALDAADGASTLLTQSGSLRGPEAVRSLIRVVGTLSGLVEGLHMVVDALIRHAPRTDVTSYGSRSSSGVEISSCTLVRLVEAQDSSLSNLRRLASLVGEPLHPLLVSAVVEATAGDALDLDAFLELELPTVELPAYAAVLQHLLETLHGDSVRRILQLVEVLRTQVLGPPVGRRAWPAKYPLIQRLVQTYRLTPSEPLQPLAQLLAALCPELAADRQLSQIGKLVRQPAQLLATLERLSAATTQHVGFLVWNMGGPNPKLHGYRMLVDREYLVALLGGVALEAGEGVSPKYLAATATITDLPPNPVPEYFLRTVGPCTHWIVLETIGVEHDAGWRYRRPWSGESPLIPHHWLEGLDDPQAAPSPRIQNYNAALEHEILGHVQAPYMTYQQLTRDEVVREEMYWRNLRSRIRKAAMADWTRRVGKVSAARVAEALRSGDFYARLVSHVVDEIVMSEASPEGLSPAAQQMLGRELQISYAQQVDRIREGLRGVVEGAAVTIARSAKGARQSPAEVWDAAIEEGLTRYISRRNNVYLLLDTKSQLLQRTLVRA
jgi:hypothetical protein